MLEGERNDGVGRRKWGWGTSPRKKKERRSEFKLLGFVIDEIDTNEGECFRKAVT